MEDWFLPLDDVICSILIEFPMGNVAEEKKKTKQKGRFFECALAKSP